MFVRTSRARACVLAVATILGFLIVHSTVDFQLLPTQLKQLHILFDWRTERWNWQDTPDETLCRNLSGTSSSSNIVKSFLFTKRPIPNVVHFVLLAKEGSVVDLSYAHFLAIKAAVVRMNAGEIKLLVLLSLYLPVGFFFFPPHSLAHR